MAKASWTATSLCAVLVASGCTRGDEGGGQKQDPFGPTSELVGDSELAFAVDALAAANVKSRWGGPRNNVDERLRAVTRMASRADLKVLLRHESPIVRAYVASYVARNEAALLEAVGPLMRDSAEVDPSPTGHSTVASVVLASVCHSQLPGHEELLRDAVAHDDTHAETALRCLLDEKDAYLAHTVERILLDSSRPQALREQALRVFTLAPTQSPCSHILAGARNAETPARHLHIAALSRCKDWAAFEFLQEISEAGSGDVEAKIALLLHPWTSYARMDRLASEPGIVEMARPRMAARSSATPPDTELRRVAFYLAMRGHEKLELNAELQSGRNE